MHFLVCDPIGLKAEVIRFSATSFLWGDVRMHRWVKGSDWMVHGPHGSASFLDRTSDAPTARIELRIPQLLSETVLLYEIHYREDGLPGCSFPDPFGGAAQY